MSLETFTAAYIEAMFFASYDMDAGGPLDDNYDVDDIDADALNKINHDCKEFYEAHQAKWNDPAWSCHHPSEYPPDVHAGHDFWLTRNGHGAGFWDGDWPNQLGEELTTAAKAYGELNPYVSDDGHICLE